LQRWLYLEEEDTRCLDGRQASDELASLFNAGKPFEEKTGAPSFDAHWKGLLGTRGECARVVNLWLQLWQSPEYNAGCARVGAVILNLALGQQMGDAGCFPGDVATTHYLFALYQKPLTTTSKMIASVRDHFLCAASRFEQAGMTAHYCSALEQAASVWSHLGNVGKQRELLDRALCLQRAHCLPSLTSASALVWACVKLRDYDTALKLQMQIGHVLCSAYGMNSAEMHDAVIRLGLVSVEADKLDEARMCASDALKFYRHGNEPFDLLDLRYATATDDAEKSLIRQQQYKMVRELPHTSQADEVREWFFWFSTCSTERMRWDFRRLELAIEEKWFPALVAVKRRNAPKSMPWNPEDGMIVEWDSTLDTDGPQKHQVTGLLRQPDLAFFTEVQHTVAPINIPVQKKWWQFWG